MTKGEMARIVHQCWASYMMGLGHPFDPIPTDDILGSIERGIDFVAAHRADIHPGMSHEEWMRDRLAHGWVYGPVKNVDAKTHPDLVPFADLPVAEKNKDVVFINAVRLLLDGEAAPMFGAV